MKRLALALPLLLVAGCAATRPYAPVRDVAYQAMGVEPFWALAIGDDSIVLRTSGGERRWPRVLPRRDGSARVWHSAEGANAITVTASPEGCQPPGGRAYRDMVLIRLDEDLLAGCGGPLLDRERR
jgi:uncharacterized membrane protein